jgi:subtilisin family serine protease
MTLQPGVETLKTAKNHSLLSAIALMFFSTTYLYVSDLAAKSPPVVPDRWIVQLEAPPVVRYEGSGNALMAGAEPTRTGPGLAATAPSITGADRLDATRPEIQAYAGWLDEQRQDLLDQAASLLGRKLHPTHTFRYLQNGFAATMTAEEAARLATLPGVVDVQPDQMHFLELERGPSKIGANKLWAGEVEGLGPKRGEGIVIGVIDSGINWEHRMFSDDPGDTDGYQFSNPLGQQLGLCTRSDVHCNEKLIGVYNFTDETGTNGRDPDGHGSHVAATAAGNRRSVSLDFGGGASNYVLSGVAPRAHVISYKVCLSDPGDNEAQCPGSAISQALEQAIEDGVHIINYSIGSTTVMDPWLGIGNDNVTDIAELFLNVRAAGIMPVTSAGNSGEAGAGSITSPAHAPWTLAVGNSTHARVLANRATVAGESNLVAREGTGPELQQDLETSVVSAESVDPNNFLGCSSFPSGSFASAIAVIGRGTCTFETKVTNAYHAGAEAVLVVNHQPGPPILMGGLEGTSIPAFMLSNQDGARALAAMDEASNPTATIRAGLSRLVRLDQADHVAPTSSRGPAPFVPGLMKPNLMAPGTAIISAGSQSEDSYAMSSGTSMSGPHVAGAVALVMSARPDWTLDMIQSALETTAEAEPMRVGESPANINDRGAGRARVDRAVRAGLYLPVDVDDFVSADPGQGGDPGQLNLAGIYVSGCVNDCTYTRTVRAIEGGAWAVNTIGDLDIEVVPDSFSLAAGEEQELSISVTGFSGTGDVILDGAVELVPDNEIFVTQRLPVGMAVELANLPDRLNINANHERGRTTFPVEIQAVLSDLYYRSSALIRPQLESFNLPQHAFPSDPFAGGDGTRTFLVDVPEDALLLWVETVASSSPDIDLYVGIDENGNGQADPDELVCESITPNSLEECLIEHPAAGTWWILVQNYQASNQHSEDHVQLEFAALTESSGFSLAPDGPARHAGGLLELTLAWDQPAMRRDERWLGAVVIAAGDDGISDLGVVPVRVRRSGAYVPLPTPIFVGQPRPTVVPAEGRDDLLYFDVSPGASEVSVTVQGSASVSAELRHMNFDEVSGHAPGTPPAAGTLMAIGAGSSAGFTLLSTAEPGRWYVVLDNTSSQEALVDVEVEVFESDPRMSQRGLWSPRDRVIYQGIEWQQAGPGFLTWYSYDDGGLPVFYQAAGNIEPSSSSWSAYLERVTNATGDQQRYDRIGEVSLTMIDDDTMIFAWRRDGFHGSEIMSPDAAQTCPEVGGEVTSYSGHWYSPGQLVGGTTVIVTDSVQGHVRYYFDDLGVGRWLLASDPEQDPLNEVLELLDFRGFCPDCEEVEVQMHPVGVYERHFESESSGTEVLDFMSADPLHHLIQFEVPVIKLSDPIECQ